MKVELFKVINSYVTFKGLFGTKLKGSLAFKVLNLIKEIETHLVNFEEAKKKIVEDKGLTFDETGKLVNEDKEVEAELNAELGEIFRSEVQIHAKTLTIDELDRLEISPEELMNIEWAIENGDNS